MMPRRAGGGFPALAAPCDGASVIGTTGVPEVERGFGPPVAAGASVTGPLTYRRPNKSAMGETNAIFGATI